MDGHRGNNQSSVLLAGLDASHCSAECDLRVAADCIQVEQGRSKSRDTWYQPARKIARHVHETARDVARRITATGAYVEASRRRKKVEMLFAHLKRILRLDRLRLRGPKRRQRRVPPHCNRPEPPETRETDPGIARAGLIASQKRTRPFCHRALLVDFSTQSARSAQEQNQLLSVVTIAAATRTRPDEMPPAQSASIHRFRKSGV